MNLLDARSIMLLLAAMYLVLPLALIWAVRPTAKHAVRSWIVGSLCVGVGLLLIAARDHLAVPLTFHLANTLLLSSFVFWWQSIQIHIGRPLKSTTFAAHILTSLLVFSVLYASLEPVIRASSVRVLLGVLALIFGAYSWLQSIKLNTVNGRFLSVAFVLMGLAFLMHGVITGRGSDPSPFASGWNAVVFSSILLACVVVIHFAVFGMNLELNAQKRLNNKVERLVQEESYQLKQKINQFERQNQLRSAASHLAHEINQPLTATLAMSQLCIRALNSSQVPTSKIVDNIDKVAQNIKRASALLHSLSDESQLLHPALEPVDLENCVINALGLVDTSIQQGDIDVKTHLALGSQVVMANPLYLTQILTNLIRNAIEAMGQTPRRQLRISARVHHNKVRISVTDTGPKVSPETISKLEQPYNSSKTEGLGIGLTICRGLLAKQNSLLHFEPNQPQGLVVYFDLGLPRSLL